VEGADALRWLDALLTADLEDLAPGRARRALLLSPTGGVRAAVTVARPEGSVLLLQDPVQARPVLELLAPYVLSSDVRLQDRTGELALLAFPGREEPPAVSGGWASAPSVLGRGVDLILPAEERGRVLGELRGASEEASEEDVEAWRVASGIARFGVDGEEGDLPAECGLEDAVSFGKGCFLGQEAVAKVRNLGHPRRVLRHLEATGPVRAGEPVLADGREAGAVTSAGVRGGGWFALVRVRWEARDAPLRTASGAELAPLG